MSYTGRIRGGSVVLDNPVELPEGAAVKIVLIEAAEEGSSPESSSSVLDKLAPFIGAVEGLPPDLAKNHDHYLHGLPKR